eukprot:NODE_1381_length_979_cov_286.765591_g605_i1.p3 GENE.NODE_1381_length_979_cov_286.765591_g605_i1~~NODE_1381_length_979_cov_286.765591_g605_i1.p3  ORF type:complete len:137 (-),score=42.32 NODE_1381_length_979_cov_286.765591_g605_i1:568-957(-)
MGYDPMDVHESTLLELDDKFTGEERRVIQLTPEEEEESIVRLCDYGLEKRRAARQQAAEKALPVVATPKILTKAQAAARLEHLTSTASTHRMEALQKAEGRHAVQLRTGVKLPAARLAAASTRLSQSMR